MHPLLVLSNNTQLLTKYLLPDGHACMRLETVIMYALYIVMILRAFHTRCCLSGSSQFHSTQIHQIKGNSSLIQFESASVERPLDRDQASWHAISSA